MPPPGRLREASPPAAGPSPARAGQRLGKITRLEGIEIVEEAQFLGRTLRVQHLGRAAPITIEVSEHVALVRDLMMGPDLAAKVLYALGRDNADPGELTLESLRTLLQDHRIYEAFCAAKISPIYDSLTFLAFTDCGEQVPVLEWNS